MPRLSSPCRVFVLALAVASCSDSPSGTGESCDPGWVQTCTCADGAAGLRTCLDDGTVSACACEIPCETEVPADFCDRLGLECGSLTGTDACGVTITADCGRCTAPEVCGARTPNMCDAPACAPESDADICARLGKDCGDVAATDNCGAAREADCGVCLGGELCGATTANVCGAPPCVGESDEALCARLGKDCGTLAAIDNCGAERAAECGGCPGGGACGAVTANVCAACRPESDAAFCARLGKDCGEVAGDDNCGDARTATCGTCGADAQCGVTTPNMCGPRACTPETDAAFCTRLRKDCGEVSADDNCGDARTATCGTCGPDELCGATLANVCGAAPCVPDDDATMCAARGKDCGTVAATDNCGKPRALACGTCAEPDVCGARAANECGCPRETDAALCDRLDKDCGEVSADDACGEARTVDCGRCASNLVCGSVTANVCGPKACVPESDATFCARLGKECGEVAATDNCGQARTATCGTCGGLETCGALAPNQCGCVAETNVAFCARLGKECGSVRATDNCGASRNAPCGTCSGTETCGALAANMCDCAPETDAAMCQRLGKNCGTVTASDRCGTSRTVSCGSCGGTDVCGVATANVCGPAPCTPETNDAFCARLRKECGTFGGTDNCGVARSASCGSCDGDDECEANRCVSPCEPESDDEMCERLDVACGELSDRDNCGERRTIDDCGTCSDPETCDPSGQCTTCGTLGRAGCCGDGKSYWCDEGTVHVVDCGVVWDGSCGWMPETEVNYCGSTDEDPSAPVDCADFEFCAPETDLELCAAAGYACGELEVEDGCGQARLIDCGGCGFGGYCNDEHACATACDGLDFAGCCGEGAVYWCEAGRVFSAACNADTNGACGWYNSFGGPYYECGGVAPDPFETPRTCDGFDLCVGESDAELRVGIDRECGAQYITDRCGVLRFVWWDACDVGELCLPDGHCGDHCGTLGDAGCCFESTLTICGDDGEPHRELCRDGCGWDAALERYACGGDDPEPADDHPASCLEHTYCVPLSHDDFCAYWGASCGEIEAYDPYCGGERTEDCGTCADGTECGLREDNVCGCPQTDEELCASYGLVCGSWYVTDACGLRRAVASCGPACGEGEYCGAEGTCEPTCGDLGYVGCCAGDALTFWCEGGAVFSDSCVARDGTSSCGWAPDPDNYYYCGETGEDPSATYPRSCDAYTFCVPESDTDFCARAQVPCGPASGIDNCGTAREVDECGPCPSGSRCDEGQCLASCGDLTYLGCCDGATTYWCESGTVYSTACSDDCGWSTRGGFGYYCSLSGEDPSGDVPRSCDAYDFCRSQSDESLCADNGWLCGVLQTRDNCGVERAVLCGDACGSGEYCNGGQCQCVPGTAVCQGDDLATCLPDGDHATVACGKGACEEFALGAYCQPTIATEPLSGKVTYEYRTHNDERLGWGPRQTTVLPSALVVSYAYDDGTESYSILDTTVSDEEGDYTIAVSATPSPYDLVVVWLVSPDPSTGEPAVAVANPDFFAPSFDQHDPYETYESTSSYFWSFAFAVDQVPGDGALFISEDDGSGAARVFDYQRYIYEVTRYEVFGQGGLTNVAWMQPRVSWSCGACFNDVAISAAGEAFESQMWIGYNNSQGYWSDAVNAHELGHWAMSSFGTSPREGGPHAIGVWTLPGQAWSEGFATFFSSLVRQDELYFDRQGEIFFWFDLKEMDGYFIENLEIAPFVLPTADGYGYPDPADPLLQLMDESVVAAFSLAIAADDWRSCDDSCGGVNGACEDGGPGSVAETCAFGSDCTDCGAREPARPALWDTGGLLAMYALAGPTLNVTKIDPAARFARGYVRHSWFFDGGPVDIVAHPDESKPMFADYLDALRCLVAEIGSPDDIAEVDALIDTVILDYPYPTDLPPLCYGDL